MMGTYLPEKCSEVKIIILRNSVHLVGFIKKMNSGICVTGVDNMKMGVMIESMCRRELDSTGSEYDPVDDIA